MTSMEQDPINPYYGTDALASWEMLSFDEPNLSYEFNTLCFWKTPNGVFTAQDSGCSCPTPFEDYCGNTPAEIEQKLERVGSIEQGERVFDAWNKNYDGGCHVDIFGRNRLTEWLKGALK